jgi:hypothetical protein
MTFRGASRRLPSPVNVFALALLALLTCLARSADACGASGGGAIVSACSLSEHEEAVRKKWRVGALYAFTSTAIRFSSDLRLDETRHVVLATLSYLPSPRWSLDLGLGSIVGGKLGQDATAFEFSPGFAATAGASWRLLESEGARPFVLFTGQIAFETTSTTPEGARTVPSAGYHALDVRLGAAAGYTFWRTLSPYLVVRGFGGPVFWEFQREAVTGTDTHHYQVGGGLSVVLAKRVDLFVEGVPLGEQGVTAGAGIAL